LLLPRSLSSASQSSSVSRWVQLSLLVYELTSQSPGHPSRRCQGSYWAIGHEDPVVWLPWRSRAYGGQNGRNRPDHTGSGIQGQLWVAPLKNVRLRQKTPNAKKILQINTYQCLCPLCLFPRHKKSSFVSKLTYSMYYATWAVSSSNKVSLPPKNNQKHELSCLSTTSSSLSTLRSISKHPRFIIIFVQLAFTRGLFGFVVVKLSELVNEWVTFWHGLSCRTDCTFS